MTVSRVQLPACQFAYKSYGFRLMDCIFCKIVQGEIPADIVFQDEEFLAFKDINPQSPTHILLIPKKHIESVAQTTQQHKAFLGRLILTANRVARLENILERGYRLVINCGPDGRQVVPHLHLHILGGRQMEDQLG